MSGKFAAVVVAAGLSSRMKDFKPLLPLCGDTVLARVAGVLREGGVEDIRAVAGHRAGEVELEAARLGVGCVVNRDFERGMFSSVVTGLASLPGGLDGVLMLPVDIPLVRAATIRKLLASFDGKAVTRPLFRGEPGHPPLIAAGNLPFILGFDGAGGLRGALGALERTHGALDVPVSDANILFDMDTPEDYREGLRRADRLGRPTLAEAEALLDIQAVVERGREHARAVAGIALAMARAMNEARSRAGGQPLDLVLVECAALLHDIAKGRPGHEAEGGSILDAAGFPDAARIVAAHRDIVLAPHDPITEREIVYLADKFVSGSRLVDIRRRFQEKLDRFGADPEAAAAIRGRRDRALGMLARLETETGMAIADILDRAGLDRSRAALPGARA